MTPLDDDNAALHRIDRQLRGHIPVLDGWRGLAILLVILHNASFVTGRDGSLLSGLYHTATETGWVGVSVFFVLSGFLITGILLDTLGQPGYFRDFYIRRTLRIFPLYYVVLIGAFVVVPLLPAALEWSRLVERDQWWFWTYLSNWHTPADYGIPGFGHFWSLAVEEQFYLVWPALLFLTGRRWFPWVALSTVIAAPLIRTWMILDGMSLSAPYAFTIARFDGLAIGGLLALALRHPGWRERLYRIRVPATFVIVGLLLAVAAPSRGFPPRDVWTLTAGQSLVSFLTALLMLSTLAQRHRWERETAKAVDAGWLKVLGKYSYAIYIAHLPIHYLIKDVSAGFIVGTSPVVGTLLTVAYAGILLLLSLGFALFSWRFLERPLLALKDVWAPRRTQGSEA